MNDPLSAETFARRFVDAINRHSNELADLMTGDHTFIDSLGAVLQGKERAQAAWAGYFAMVPDYRIALEEVFVRGPVAILLGTASGTYAPDGRLSEDRRWSTPAAWRVVIHGSKVQEWRVYADNEPLRGIMKNAPAGA